MKIEIESSIDDIYYEAIKIERVLNSEEFEIGLIDDNSSLYNYFTKEDLINLANKILELVKE